ncbi:putative major pilin subunit [Anaerohalosphaera lusitana]|uniref:Putative major pilin subunit n=1 Tax=Anaerohalosphaera lusitana TaxID=1936003 RepID=A0A1U9NNX6_9BACT|nr:putative major pilin subunit [Anaerohalosphaera lusitana]
MSRNKGFTLIELLVVISIIALLLAIMMPALQKVKLVAEEVICRSNLKQYGLAGELYRQDNGDKFPNAWDSVFRSRDPARGCQWHDASRHPEDNPELQGTLWDYLGGGTKVHYCRTFARYAKTADAHVGHNDSIPIEPLFCYSMNAFLGGFESYNPASMVIKSSQVRRPSTVFFFAEENAWPYESSETDPYYPYNRYQQTLNDNALCGGPYLPYDVRSWDIPRDQVPPYQDAFGSFHKTSPSKLNDGMANSVFVDGHVEMVEPDRTWYYTKPMDGKPAIKGL